MILDFSWSINIFCILLLYSDSTSGFSLVVVKMLQLQNIDKWRHTKYTIRSFFHIIVLTASQMVRILVKIPVTIRGGCSCGFWIPHHGVSHYLLPAPIRSQYWVSWQPLHQSEASIENWPAGEDPPQRQAAVRQGVHQGGVGVRQQGLEVPA